MKQKIFLLLVLISCFLSLTRDVYAVSATQTAINNGINYLGTQLDGQSGQITGGSTGDASPWAAIAFSANGIDPSTVKTSTTAPSLVDYFQTNHPTTASSATEWEKWILAITASGKDPTNFGGINYVSAFESTYYTNNQIGDSSTDTDDWFGVMALVSSGVATTDAVLTDSLADILSHQNADGGFGYATTAGSDGNDTAAATQALVVAKNYGVTNSLLDCAIVHAKTYLLSTQDSSGGFLYDTNPWTTAPDSDSTTWALMALNVLGMNNSDQASKAQTWLLSQQSTTDGGFTACNAWDPNTFACTGYASNSTTTSHALIALSGKGWVIKSSPLSSVPSCLATSATITVTPTPSVIPTPTSTVSLDNSANPTSTPAPTATPTPDVLAANLQSYKISPTPSPIISPIPTTTQAVLGTQTEQKNTTQILFIYVCLGLGLVSLGIWGFQQVQHI